MHVDIVERLDDRQPAAVLSLVEAATHVDGTAPLSEQVLLAVRGRPPVDTDPAPSTSSRHFLAYDSLAYAGTQLAGYAHLERGAGETATAELVVGPTWRRQGIGTALVRAIEAAITGDPQAGESRAGGSPLTGPLRLWSHGHLEAARAFALRDGYSAVRELWQMRRPLGSEDDSLPAVTLPDGFLPRAFVVGQDEEAWLRTNSQAFADHPEQGRMTRDDLDQRIAEPWFDPSGFILIEDSVGHAPVLAASHWTKVVPSQSTQASAALHPVGEVYVVGVHPAYQGLGLGRAVTVLGLVRMRERGLTEAMLYVDADNRAAVATYSRLGFTRSAVDVMYSPVVHPPV